VPTLKLFLAMAGLSVLCFAWGCESDSDSDGSDNGSGSLGGTWTGTTAGRPLTMTLAQDGTTLSGSYRLENPVFTEGLSGTASRATAPATATLVGGGDRKFIITFNSANSMSGGFYKGAAQVGSVSATK
jgi:hypothetical protein